MFCFVVLPLNSPSSEFYTERIWFVDECVDGNEKGITKVKKIKKTQLKKEGRKVHSDLLANSVVGVKCLMLRRAYSC